MSDTRDAPVSAALAQALADIETFSRAILNRPLRPYQVEPARAAAASALAHDGEQYVWRFPRQSGKNETLAHLHAYLLLLHQRQRGACIVHTAPTYDPQCRIAMRRLLDITAGSPYFRRIRTSGNVISLGQARIVFLSGMERDHPNVGSTASLLLSRDECQDLERDYIERAFDPMTAAANAPHIHTGTARHTGTYLASKRMELEQRERADGKRRCFIIGWQAVAQVNPAYGQHVRGVIERLGVLHPAVQTEYQNVESEQTGRLFDERRVALIFNTLQTRAKSPDGGVHIITIDVGGASLLDCTQHQHDMTVAAVHRLSYNAAGLSVFTTLDYLVQQGTNVLDDTPDRRCLFAYIDLWSPASVVVDSTGLGVGLASALIARYKQRVLPFRFSATTKTELLHAWLALIETGRYRHYAQPEHDLDLLRLRAQLAQCEHETRGAHVAWGVPVHVTWRNPRRMRDESLHDDHLTAAALSAALADADLRPREAVSIAAPRRRRGAEEQG